MGAVVSVVWAAVLVVLSVALLGFAGVTLGFAGEAYRRGMTPLHQAFNAVAMLAALAPLAVTLWVCWRRFFSGRSLEGVPLGWGLPLVAWGVCAGACFLSFYLGEWATSRHRRAVEAQERAALRAEVEGGAHEKACDLVLKDPAATHEDMRRCRARIESLTEPGERWRELEKFMGPNAGFQTWNPRQLGLLPKWDFNKSVVAVRYEQAWFIRTFYEAWLARPGAFQTEESLNTLTGLLRYSTRRAGWTPEAVEVLKAQVLPEIGRRVDAVRGPPRQGDTTWAHWLREAMAAIQEPAEDERVPPVPKPGAVPEGSIGLARLDEDETLHLWMRATPGTGSFGDTYFSFRPYDEHYGAVKRHVGWTLGPGEVRPVPPL